MGNQVTCLKVLPQQIQTIVNLAAEHQEKAPEFLDLLNNIVKVKERNHIRYLYLYLSIMCFPYTLFWLHVPITC